MPRTLDELREKALELPAHERIELAHDLLDSVDDAREDEDPAEVEAAWADEIKRRVEEVDTGVAETAPAAEVFARARAQVRAIAEARVQPR